MAYRDEKEEKGPRVVHEWHLLPKLPTFDEHVFVKILGLCLAALLIAATVGGIAWGAFYFYDWRMGRLH